MVDAIFIDSLLPSDERGGVFDIVHGTSVTSQIFDVIASGLGNHMLLIMSMLLQKI